MLKLSSFFKLIIIKVNRFEVRATTRSGASLSLGIAGTFFTMSKKITHIYYLQIKFMDSRYSAIEIELKSRHAHLLASSLELVKW